MIRSENFFSDSAQKESGLQFGGKNSRVFLASLVRVPKKHEKAEPFTTKVVTLQLQSL